MTRYKFVYCEPREWEIEADSFEEACEKAEKVLPKPLELICTSH